MLHRWPEAVCLAATALVVALGLRFEWKLDDAYIAFSYAQNLVHGNGLVFNIGERVEGYTCFLWVLLSALGLWLRQDIVIWSTALGLVSAGATVFAVWGLAAELSPLRLRPLAAAACILVAAFPPFAWWAASGMETALFTCLVTVSVWLHLRRGAASLAAPIILGLASMTRPEAWLLAALLCLDALRTGPWPLACRYCALFLATFGPYYGWRCLYYGYPLPNTFYAKVGESRDQISRGIEYLGLFVSTVPGVLLIAGTVLAASSPVRQRAGFLFVFLLGYFGYVVAVGGDVFPLDRFFVPILPLLAALAVAGLLHWTDRLAARASAAAIAICALLAVVFVAGCVPLYIAQKRQLGVTRIMNNFGQLVCPYVRERVGPDEAVAAIGIGQLKYCTDRQVIDLVGLTDAHIAHRAVPHMGAGLAGHERYDSEYVLARRPKYIFIPLRNAPLPLLIEPVRDLWNNPRLDRDYVGERSGPFTMWYRRRDAPPLMPRAQ